MADARVNYIQERMEQSLAGTDYSPSVESLLGQSKSRQIMTEFFKAEGPDKIIFFCQRPAGVSEGKCKLQFSTGRDELLTGKCCYFTRVSLKGVDPKSLETDISFGEIIGTPLGSFRTMVEEMFKPALESRVTPPPAERAGPPSADPARAFAAIMPALHVPSRPAAANDEQRRPADQRAQQLHAPWPRNRLGC